MPHATSGAAGSVIAASATPNASSERPISSDKVSAVRSQLEPLIADGLKTTGVPGLAIAIVHNDKIVAANG